MSQAEDDEIRIRGNGVDRLAGDAALESRLRSVDFAGPEYEYFAGEIARYGYAVLRKWCRTGEIVPKCHAKRVRARALPDWVVSDADALDDIIQDIVSIAIVKFRDDVLVPGKWDPAKGASLRTYFIGQCLFRYPNARELWLNNHGREFAVAELHEALDVPQGPGADHDLLRAVAVESTLRHLSDDRARLTFSLLAQGYTQDEIAAHLGTTRKAVERYVARERARQRSRRTA